MARPTIYSAKLATSILTRMISGESVRSICSDDSMPDKSTVFQWVADDKEGFSDRYAKAFQARMVIHADELLDIADDGTNDYMLRENPDGDAAYAVNGEAVARSRLRVDTRKWLLSKLTTRYSDGKEEDNKVDLAEVISKLLDKLPN